jgi:hypothetical protein
MLIFQESSFIKEIFHGLVPRPDHLGLGDGAQWLSSGLDIAATAYVYF